MSIVRLTMVALLAAGACTMTEPRTTPVESSPPPAVDYLVCERGQSPLPIRAPTHEDVVRRRPAVDKQALKQANFARISKRERSER